MNAEITSEIPHIDGGQPPDTQIPASDRTAGDGHPHCERFHGPDDPLTSQVRALRKRYLAGRQGLP